MATSGPAAESLLAALGELEVFRSFRSGATTRDEYVAGLESQADRLDKLLGSPRNLRLLAARYPPDFDRHADEILDLLIGEGLAGQKPPTGPFEDFREKMRRQFDHGDRRTFIHPDEARLAYMVSAAKKPRRMIALGSYYGYWAAWAMPGVEAAQGEAVLVDPNEAVCDLARANFETLGFAGRTSVLAQKGEDVLPSLEDGSLDLVFLDANAGRGHADPAYDGKGIYSILAEAAFPKMAEGALLIAHNDYIAGVGDNRLSQPFVQRHAERLERFHTVCAERFRKHNIFATPDGFGVYIK
jgi:predicted O-methyltransferase YrrM